MKDKNIIIVGLLVSLLIGVWVYSQQGNWRQVNIAELHQQLQNIDLAQEDAPQQFEQLRLELINELKSAIAAQPRQAEYWLMMGDLLMESQKYEQAATHYAAASRLSPEDVQLSFRYIEAKFMANSFVIDAELQSKIDGIIAKDPAMTSSITANLFGFQGVYAYRQQQYEKALEYWRQVVKILPPQDPSANVYRQYMLEALKKTGALTADGKLVAAHSGSASASNLQSHVVDKDNNTDSNDAGTAKADNASIKVDLSLSAALQDLANSKPRSTTVFVYLRSLGGAPMPLAIKRLRLADLPTTIELSDADAMMAGGSLAASGELELIARVSESGNARTSPGDWQGQHSPIVIDASKPQQTVALVIDQRL